MKLAELEKLKGSKIGDRTGQPGTTGRFGAGSAQTSRREKRKLDQAQGLVPFAVKIDSALANQIHALALERKTGLSEVVAELLKKALAR